MNKPAFSRILLKLSGEVLAGDKEFGIDPQKAKDKLGWTPKINLETLISEMIKNDLEIAQQSNLRNRVRNF